MNDAVDSLIVEREKMDHGFEGGLVLSVVAHLMLVGAAIAAPYLAPKKPRLEVVDGIIISVPPGGGGPRNPEPATPAATTAPNPEPAAPEPPPKFIKPPSKTEPPKTKGLPAPDAKKAKKTQKDDPPPVAPATDKTSAKAGGANPVTPGMDVGAVVGPGLPSGTDWLGDWYVATVQQRIWSIWTQAIRTGLNQTVSVRFSILEDGSVTDVTIVQSSGATMLDLAAQRAIYSAAPFSRLPKNYGTNRITLQANFRPN